MRLVALLVAVFAAASCDIRRSTGDAPAGALSLEVPRLAPTYAAQTGTVDDRYEVARVNVRISESGTEVTVFERDYSDSDIDDPGSEEDEIAGRLTVAFPLPESGARMFVLQMSVYNRLNELMFTAGPTTFTLDGARTTVTTQAVYVGPGSEVTSVLLSPRSLNLSVGQEADVTCSGSPTPLGGEFPHRVVSLDPAVASVQGLRVRGEVPGTTQIQCRLEFGTRAVDQIPVTVTGASGGSGTITGTARDATTAGVLSGVLVELRAGDNVTAGTPLRTTLTNSSGQFTFSDVAPGTYTIRGTASGYFAATTVVNVTAGGSSGALLALSPGLLPGQASITLSWGAQPADLDLYLYVPGAPTPVYWGIPGTTGSPYYAVLEQDERFGFGPETITISQLMQGTYYVYVHDYTNGTGPATGLRNSTARVTIDFGDSSIPSQTFSPPVANGVTWRVFAITVGSGGSVAVTPLGNMLETEPPIGGTASAASSDPVGRPPKDGR